VIVASSWGDRTPFYTPARKLEWKFRQYGVEPIHAGETGEGTYFVGRLTEDPSGRGASG
jgi:hypothetical protein